MSTGSSDLPHLIKLMDDPSPVVRQGVRERITQIQDDCGSAILNTLEVSSADHALHESFLREIRKEGIVEDLERWSDILTDPVDEWDALEDCLGLLVEYLHPNAEQSAALGLVLDELAQKFNDSGSQLSPKGLATFLYKESSFSGNTDNYYAPQNSNLLWVIENRVGNPISLACVYMLVGKRIGLEISGCNYPGHFLARVESRGMIYLVDCFNAGTFYSSLDLSLKYPLATKDIRNIIEIPATSRTVVIRTLRNLENSFERHNLPSDQEAVGKLWKHLIAGDTSAI